MTTPDMEQTSRPGDAVDLQGTGSKARKALFWSVLNNVVGRAGTLLTGIVLARILVPEDYGIYAVALVALAALLSMNELGVSVAVVRWTGDVTRIAPTVTTLALASSAVLWAVCFVAAPVVCRAMNAPAATDVLRVLTFSVLIDAATAVPAALMTRNFMQRERMVVDLAGFVATAVVGIGLAVAGFGAWALVASMLLGNVVNAAFILRYVPQRFMPGFDRTVAKELLAFGLPLAASSLLVFALLNVDYVIIGRMLGPTAVGLYLLAFNLSAWPVNLFSAPVRRVSLPAFARLHESPEGAAPAFVHAATALLLVTLPACLLLSILAGPLIDVVYGDKWLAAAQVLPWLMVLATMRVLGELIYDFLAALGRARPNFTIQLLWFVALLPALWIGARASGIVGVAAGHALVALLLVMPAYVVVVHRSGVSLRRLASAVSRPVLATVVAAAAGLCLKAVVTTPLMQLLLVGAVVGLVYLAIVFPMRTLLRAGSPVLEPV